MSSPVTVDALSVDYAKGGRIVHALRDLTLRLDEPSITGLVGRNRAGKSTLLRVLAGWEPRYSGTASVYGAEPTRAFGKAVLAGDRWPYSEGQTFGTLTRALSRVHAGFDQRRFLQLMDRFGVDPRTSTQSRGSVSSGLVCLALAARAPLTMLDEPTLGMDAPSRRIFAETIVEEQLEVPRIMIVSTHLIDESADLFERVIVLEEGVVRADADPSVLVAGFRRVAGALDAVAALETVGPVARLGNHAEAIAHAGSVPDSMRAAPVGLQELVSALTEPTRR